MDWSWAKYDFPYASDGDVSAGDLVLGARQVYTGVITTWGRELMMRVITPALRKDWVIILTAHRRPKLSTGPIYEF